MNQPTGYHSDGSWTSSLGDVLDEVEEEYHDQNEEQGEDTGAMPLATMRLRGGGGRERVDETRRNSSATTTSSPARRLAPPRSPPASDRRPPRTSSTSITTPPTLLDLTSIDAAFGPKSDLYRDVLGVKPNASPEQIQRAYFQRRNELFRLLADLDAEEQGNDDHDLPSANDPDRRSKKRANAERKMDGVVMAMRVLGDSALRGRYDDVRTDRLHGRTNISPVRPQKVAAVASEYRAPETTATTRKQPEDDETPPSPPQPPKKKQNQQQRPREESALANKTTTSNKVQPSKFYRRMVPGLNSKKSAPTSKEEKKLATPVAVTPEKPAIRKSSDKKKGAAAAAAAPSLPSLRWPNQSKPTVNGGGKARGIRFDMNQRREYPAPTNTDNDFDTDDDEFDESTADVNYTDEGTLLSEDPSEGTLTTAAASAALRKEESEKGFVVRVRDELCGAIEDTAASFDQVFNVFTLQDEDIRAVRYRIDKFRQQVSHSL